MKSLSLTISAQGLLSFVWHLFRISLSFSLLFADNFILLASTVLAWFSFRIRRRFVTRNVHFYPKTILVTGIGTLHGLALARAWNAEGHRVIGADVVNLHLPIRSGGSMSKALLAYYRVQKDHYISSLLDIVHREKVDIWIPCSSKSTAMEDAMARQVIESRTSCRCITLDVELTACFAHPESFRQYLVEKDLPVLEHHTVQSRDSIHKILHRSPSKSYQIQRLSPGVNAKALTLPKRTLSKTYSEVSEIQINKECPWVLQQQPRLGEFFADLLVVRGQVHAIKVRLIESRSPHWGASPLDEALAVAIHRLMGNFAQKGGLRMTGHLSVQLFIDEEFGVSSVRHTILIADCIPGANAVRNLLRDARCPVKGYIAILSPESNEPASWDVTATLSPMSRTLKSVGENAGTHLVVRFHSWSLANRTIAAVKTELQPFIFWRDPRFSFEDPLPWWWHVHVYQPLQDILLLIKQTREAGLT
ncbi:hypothetical protein N7495_001040 [Penicillium taxi]|uniref:uncharacterized protein n=1 Tax=Penicillium taxi TaxID=168475 RepID=UPI0025455146|nr:uncharacterized protein N7495_001040 [Penicillium taxi]KAJ5908358.1 hypothetical protein N7495_001040 [Penicillium taxi]